MRDAVIAALTRMVEQDSSIVLLTGDLGFKVFDDFKARCCDNFLNAGIAEQNMTAMACGMALEGAKVFTYSIGNFPTVRCLEQLRNDVCYHHADVTVLAVGGGFSYGQLGMSHFAIEDLAFLRALPDMTVVAPSDPWQAKQLLWQIGEQGGPTYMRIDKGVAGMVPGEVELGRIREVRRGDHVAIFAIGAILGEAWKAAEQLERDGISASLYDVHTLKPLDIDRVCEAASCCGRVVTVEEHNIVGGLGSAIAETCLEGGVALRAFRRVGLNDCYPDVVGDQAYLRARYGMDAAAIATTIRDMVVA